MERKFNSALNRVFNFRSIRSHLQKFVPNESDAYSKPYITIAREPGSGGTPIAKALAEALDFEFINEQLVTEIARSVKRRREIIKRIDEKGRSSIEDIVHAALNPEYIDNNIYARELFKCILAYAYQGKVVILGRGGNFITPFAKGLHVRITAPYQVRVQRAIDYEGFNREKARKVIAKTEQERREFVRQYIKSDVKKVNAYDLTLNTTYFDVNEARDVIIEVFYQKFSHSLKKPPISFN